VLKNVAKIIPKVAPLGEDIENLQLVSVTILQVGNYVRYLKTWYT